MEPIFGGWLKKSPPDKRIWRAKWRRRWFVLKPSGEIPGQYMLEYFTDQSCRKLKGRIDLDQCEQIDVGVPLENYEHVFDIRTPKRIYYLVADQATEMNKWVNSICSVCGLQIHNEEEPEVLALPTSANAVVDRQPSPTPSTLTDGGSGGGAVAANLTRGESFTQSSLSVGYVSSSPYIPISECISGGSLNAINGFPRTTNGTQFHMQDLRDNVPDQVPPPPLKGLPPKKKFSNDFYDYPRPLHPAEESSFNRLEDHADDSANQVVPPPKVNWATYPRHEAESALYENRRRPEDDVYDHPAVTWVESNENNSSFEPIRSHQPPPRPPKPPPPHLIETIKQGNSKNNNNTYDNINNVATTLYDVPPSAQVILNKSFPVSAFASAKDSCSQSDLRIDDHYDFPRSHQTELGSTPPAPSTQSLWQRRHVYGNAPSSLIVDNDVPDTQEYLPMEPQSNQHQHVQKKESDVYTDMSGVDNRSPSNFLVYSNVPSPTQRNEVFSQSTTTPPAVNRDLKPRPPQTPVKPQPKKFNADTYNHEETVCVGLPLTGGFAPAVDRQLKPKIAFSGDGNDGTGHAPTTITLSPAADSAFSHPPKGKRSFRKQRASPCPSPTAPSNSLNPNGMLVPGGGSSSRLTDRSSSDDDQSSSCSSRRNSSNDDHHPNTKPVMNRFNYFDVKKKSETDRKSPSPSILTCGRNQGRDGEIQYLDLELDGSAPAQSPKSPERPSAVQHHSTVYKTVDFVRTRAFNQMRQNVEEIYRKS